ncbi:hypothetical protein FOA52_006221, partial [Chlamydomonas sp. UWO 241]
MLGGSSGQQQQQQQYGSMCVNNTHLPRAPQYASAQRSTPSSSSAHNNNDLADAYRQAEARARPRPPMPGPMHAHASVPTTTRAHVPQRKRNSDSGRKDPSSDGGGSVDCGAGRGDGLGVVAAAVPRTVRRSSTGCAPVAAEAAAAPATCSMQPTPATSQSAATAAAAASAAAATDDASSHGGSGASTSSSSKLSVLSPDQIGHASRASPKSVLPPAVPRAGDTRVGLLYDESMERHVGPAHYECPQRVIQVFETLQDEGLMDRCFLLPARPATDAELLRVHPQAHIDKVTSTFDDRCEEQRDDKFVRVFGDLYACEDTTRAALCAAGCVVEGVQQVLSGAMSSALAVVRPPGHHAECERAMGFCFFNNCAVAARAALAHPGVSKVLVLDWDVHHGNGIQDAVWTDPNILYVSIHRHPKNFYPFVAGYPEE